MVQSALGVILRSGIGLNIAAAALADGGSSPRVRQQRPIRAVRLVRNSAAVALSLCAVAMPLMFGFCDEAGDGAGDGNPAGYSRCGADQTWPYYLGSRPLVIPNTFWMRFTVYLFSTFSVIVFFHVVDFMNDFQGKPLCSYGFLWRCLHVFSIVDTRMLVRNPDPPPWRRYAIFVVLSVLSTQFIILVHTTWLHDVLPSVVLLYLETGLFPAMLVYSVIDLAYAGWDIILHLFGLGMPKGLHSNPILSSSVQEFWGVRWNRVIGTSLASHFFNPIVGIKTCPPAENPGNLSPRSRRQPQKPSVFYAWLGVSLTFLASGLFHSFPFYVAKRDIWRALSLHTFFVVEGLLCAFEKLFLMQYIRKMPPWARRVTCIGLILGCFPLMGIAFVRIFDGFCVWECGWLCCFI
ncbi:hypothetical protein Pelo_2629 [Pelomyxa schiedti]|nr:hypothetical protein Pelo_2629 [Pelomyxa schiedti]